MSYYVPSAVPYVNSVDVAVARANADLAMASAVALSPRVYAPSVAVAPLAPYVPLSPRAYVPSVAAAESVALANAASVAAVNAAYLPSVAASNAVAARVAADAAVSASVQRARLSALAPHYYY
eukprot:TRINITY_DN1871_c0_g2_i1.p3 TRINITY_DN1871_c0_g2~~TRINITY_DN1871_c0_g2_i1.p3  ORF type:complete len:123 (+),score=35.87 TRINITY_DN1871_c0_g2_i1:67-435(+)